MAMLSLRHRWVVTFALSVFPCVFFAESVDVPPVPTYRSNVSEVRVTFFTTDKENHPVDPIDRDDFAVVDSGVVVRDFRSLTRSNETELDTVFLIDASGSVDQQLRPTLNDIVYLLSQQQAADSFSVASFAGSQTVMICAQQCRSAEASQRLLAIRAAGPTPLFDALAFTANFVDGRRSPGVRPVLILFSDGLDTISKRSASDALDTLMNSGALLYAVDLNPSAVVPNGLEKMADATGGRYFTISQGASAVLQAALQDLRSSYVVSYPLPSHQAGFHSVRILPKHNLNLRFHCRRGYYYPAGIS
jgi:VWFA-related protein